MNNKNYFPIFCTLTLLVAAGCSAVTQDAVFTDVQNLVKERSSYTVKYSPTEDEVSTAISTYLADELTVEEAIRIALINNQELQARYEKLGVARAELIEAGLLRNPIFEAEIQFKGEGKGNGISLDIAQDLMSIFQLPLKKKIAGAQLEATKHEVAAHILDLIYETEAAFYSVQGVGQILELRKNILATLTVSAEISKRQREAGNITPLQYVNHVVLYAQAQRKLAEAHSRLFEEREKLNLLLGLWGPDSSWKFSARLPEIPSDKIDPRGLESTAVKLRPELTQARQQIEVLGGQLGITRGFRLVPELEGGVFIDGEENSKVVVGPNLALPLPIFNQGQGAIIQGEARLREAQRLYIAQAIQIRSEVRRAFNRLEVAQAQVAYDKKHLLPLSEQLVHNTQLEYNAMLVGSFELLRAKQSQIEAGKDYIEALRSYWMARADLKKATAGALVAENSAPPVDQLNHAHHHDAHGEK